MSGRLDPRARPFYPPSNQSALRLSHPNCPLKPTIENKHNDVDNHTQLSSPAASPTPRPTPSYNPKEAALIATNNVATM